MKTITEIGEIQNISDSLKIQSRTIGLVPTMGFLHEGHLSLVRKSKELCNITLVSLFVNPTQFSPSEDLEQYPRDIDRDQKLLIDEGVDFLFMPEVDEIYTKNFQTYVNVEGITQTLEGQFRPTHFRGVTTIVNILFNCVKPDYAFFGQKDAQQAAVIKRMVVDLKLRINLIMCPIVREPDGLAMSSRNIYLSANERKDSLVLNQSLKVAGEMINKGERKSALIISEMFSLINSVVSSNVDYIRIVEADTFEVVDELKQGSEYYILIACRIGSTRLIDNELIKVR
ncbi:MAG: pantoate--beta-alanine ligase [Ignavibacterium sp.]|nr:MAG: pantoate--beta-alanine ligase [Ignavibacterium sp.]